MKLIVTIDTEEDNWDRYSATNNPVSNIREINGLQRLFDQYDVRPTYLITYPVASNHESIAILKKISDSGKCEIGMHCHPWNTPPFDEKATIRPKDTMLNNLQESVVDEKLCTLHQTICDNFDITPVSFRAGRWAFSSAVARSLCHLGYRVDTSVSPYIDWGFCYGPDFRKFDLSLFKFGPEGIDKKTKDGRLLEVPATVGFLQKNFSLCQKITQSLEGPIARKLRLKGILEKLRLLNKVWLSPELSDLESMIKLTTRLKKSNFPYINLTFHSNSLAVGFSPFVQSRQDKYRFEKKIHDFLDFAQKKEITSVTLSETLDNTEKQRTIEAHSN